MAELPSGPRNRAILVLAGAGLLVVGAVAGGAAGYYWEARSERQTVERIVHDYILANPEILPQAMENLAGKESAKRLAGVREQVEKPFAQAVLGNPDGKVTLVEFSDYACGYCRQSVPAVDGLIAEHPDVRVVVRELPILSEESGEAARWALAAAEQGKYAPFHKAMYEAGRPSAETIRAAASAAGLDMARARAAAESPRVQAELERNLELARHLGFNGTPSWVAGDMILSGAVGKERLAEALAKARGG